MKIEVFGIDTCGKCSEMKQFLNDNNVEYTYNTVGIDINREDLNLLFNRVVAGVPVILLDGSEISPTDLRSKIKNLN